MPKMTKYPFEKVIELNSLLKFNFSSSNSYVWIRFFLTVHLHFPVAKMLALFCIWLFKVHQSSSNLSGATKISEPRDKPEPLFFIDCGIHSSSYWLETAVAGKFSSAALD